jgi:hypothetical protein
MKSLNNLSVISRCQTCKCVLTAAFSRAIWLF